jgi:hypothetical protein
VLALERYTPRGRWSLDWSRTRVRGGHAGLGQLSDATPATVAHSLGGEASLFRGGSEWQLGARTTWELNHNGAPGDAFNLTLSLGVRPGR